jgi:nucleotide-binding universal stress UspA family protein
VAFAAVGLHDTGARVRRIVAGVDGGDESHAALGSALDLGRATGAAVEAVTAVDDRLDVHGWGGSVIAELVDWDEIVELRRQRATADLEKVVAAADAAAAREVRVGDPAPALAEAARGADLLIIGSRSWGALDRIAVGSTAEALAHDAPCSLLILPRPTIPGRRAGDGDAVSEAPVHHT